MSLKKFSEDDISNYTDITYREYIISDNDTDTTITGDAHERSWDWLARQYNPDGIGDTTPGSAPAITASDSSYVELYEDVLNIKIGVESSSNIWLDNYYSDSIPSAITSQQSAKQVIYDQLRRVLLPPSQSYFSFGGIETKEVLAFYIQNAYVKDYIRKNAFSMSFWNVATSSRSGSSAGEYGGPHGAIIGSGQGNYFTRLDGKTWHYDFDKSASVDSTYIRLYKTDGKSYTGSIDGTPLEVNMNEANDLKNIFWIKPSSITGSTLQLISTASDGSDQIADFGSSANNYLMFISSSDNIGYNYFNDRTYLVNAKDTGSSLREGSIQAGIAGNQSEIYVRNSGTNGYNTVYIGRLYYDCGVAVFDINKLVGDPSYQKNHFNTLFSGSVSGSYHQTLSGTLGLNKTGSARVQYGIYKDWWTVTDLLRYKTEDQIVDILTGRSGSADDYTPHQSGSDIYGYIDRLRWHSSEEKQALTAFCRAYNKEFNYSSNPTFCTDYTDSEGYIRKKVRNLDDNNDTNVYITSCALYNEDGDCLAIGKISTPVEKNFGTEALFRLRLLY